MKVSDEMVERAAQALSPEPLIYVLPSIRKAYMDTAQAILEAALENCFIAHPELFVAPRGHSARCRILDIPAQYHGKRVALVPLDD